jgi:hypothetical protein
MRTLKRMVYAAASTLYYNIILCLYSETGLSFTKYAVHGA